MPSRTVNRNWLSSSAQPSKWASSAPSVPSNCCRGYTAQRLTRAGAFARLGVLDIRDTQGKRRSGAGDGNRTHVKSLGSSRSTIELHPRNTPYYEVFPARRKGRLILAVL